MESLPVEVKKYRSTESWKTREREEGTMEYATKAILSVQLNKWLRIELQYPLIKIAVGNTGILN